MFRDWWVEANTFFDPCARELFALIRTSKVLAAANGRHYVIPDDVKVLRVELVLAHRLVCSTPKQKGVSLRRDAVTWPRVLSVSQA
jgi:MoxR-like ATPase